MNQTPAARQVTIRALRPDDLDAVVAIDRAIAGRPRRAYIQRRLDAALREPARHAQFAAQDASGLTGYILARVLRGEFGRSEPALRIELVGVRREVQGQGIGTRLLDALVEHGRRKGVAELRTAAAWNDHAMLRWFDATGFALAPDRIVDCPVADGSDRTERDASAGQSDEAEPRREIDYGAPAGNDYEKLARDRADLRSMTADDLPAIEKKMREIIDKVVFQPNELRYKVYIIDEAHRLSANAFDGLLKTLEEPARHNIFILATTEPDRMPHTILSRCQHFAFRRIKESEIIEQLKKIAEHEGVRYDDAVFGYIVREADGSTGVRSFLVLLACSIAVAFASHSWVTSGMRQGGPILAASLAILFAFAVALANRFLRLGLLSRLAEQVVFVLIPPLALIFLVLGTIFVGIATPTEGGAMGATGALLLALFKRRLTLDLLKQAMDSTAKLSAFVIFILVGARVFSLTFYGVDGHVWVEELLVGLPGGEVGFLVVVNVLIFLLAFFLDFFELAFIVIPLLGPAAEKLGIDLIWFGVILGVNMQTSFMHPPFGFALFYLRSVAPKDPYIDKVTGRRMEPVTTGQIYWGAVPFVVIQCIMVGLVIAFPQMVMHYKGAGTGVDPASIKQLDIPAIPGLEGLPPLDLGPPKLD